QALAWLARSSIGKRIFRPNTLSAAYTYFKRYGGWGVFLSRFLFSFFGGFVNLLAGSQRFSYRTFLICDIAGEMVGAALSLALGWVFGASWEAAGGILNTFSLFLLGFFIVVLLLIRLLRRGKQRAQDVSCTPSNSSNSEEASLSFLADEAASTESHRGAIAAREPQGDEHLWRKSIRKLNYLFLLHFRPEQPHAGRD
ncbi:MAG TPA: VTT domain-containing protein, partial [Ktedonobacteraceae bacterium]|nr:VTT domain-containing protein [Ktedonobacteraceae bacterium]